jgi:hypothetical protein
MRDVTWDTQTCVLGWSVQGIWPPNTDGTDVNAVSASHSRAVVATANDDSSIRLRRFPCPDKAAADRVFTGHASHVTSVRFTANDRHLLSLGGADLCVMQWRHEVQEADAAPRAAAGARRPAKAAAAAGTPAKARPAASAAAVAASVAASPAQAAGADAAAEYAADGEGEKEEEEDEEEAEGGGTGAVDSDVEAEGHAPERDVLATAVRIGAAEDDLARLLKAAGSSVVAGDEAMASKPWTGAIVAPRCVRCPPACPPVSLPACLPALQRG